MKTIYFVRHGSTHGVENDIYQEFDIPLSEIGREQAVRASKFFKGKKIDTLISSTMTRASETAEIIKKHAQLNPDIQYTDVYHEGHRPTEVRGKSKHDPEVMKIINLTKENFANPDWRFSNEENFFDLKNRALEALDFVARQEVDTLLVVSHATFLKILLGTMVFGDGLTPEAVLLMHRKFAVDNTSISKATYDEGSGWRIISWNDHSHLLDKLE